jgi:hypothetical protein
MTATDRVVAALKDAGKTVKVTGQDSFIAQCPSHDDGNPSLAVRKGRGQALLFCFAGCTPQDIVASLGLRMEDLFDSPKGVNYEYRKNGKLVRTVHRTPSKQFKQSIVEKDLVTLYTTDGRESFDNLTVWIPEGEKDAEVLASIGLVAVSAPMGAAAWARCDYTPLKSARNVMIVADKDEPGLERAKGLHDLIKSWGVDVYVCHPKVGKDATDHVVAGYGMTDFVDVDIDDIPDPEFEFAVNEQVQRIMVQQEAKKRAREAELSEVSNSLTVKPLGEILEMATDHDWLVPELLERRDRFVLTGGEGSGKSYLLRQMGVAMASGFHPFDASTKIKPLKVLVVDAENTEQQWSRAAKYLTSVCTSLGSDPRSNVVVSAGTRLDFTRSADVNQVHKLLDVYKPDVLLIGPLYKLVPKEISTDDDAAPLIVALDGLRERGVTLLMEAHAGHAKGLGGERDLRPRGSSALLGWPEFGYGLQPVLGNEEMFKFQKWRGDRDARKWPTYLRKGFKGELPWMPTVNI